MRAGAGGRARGRPAARRGRRPAPDPRRQPTAAPGGCPTWAGRSPPPCSSTGLRGAEPGQLRARGGLGPVERDARAKRGRGRGGMARPGVLRLFRRDRLLQAPARRRAGASSSRPAPAPSTTTSCPPTPRPCAGGSWSSTEGATDTCAATSAPHADAWKGCWTWAYLVRAAAAGCCRARIRGATCSTRGRSGARAGARDCARPRRRATVLTAPRRAPAPTERYAGGRPLRCPRAWSTRTSPNSQRSAAPSAPLSRSWARSPVALLAGLGTSPLAEAGLAGPLGNQGVDKLSSAAGAAAALAGLAVVGVAAWLLARRPALVPVLVAAGRALQAATCVRQLQPLLRLRSHRRPARPAPAALLRARRRRSRAAWRTLRGEEVRALPRAARPARRGLLRLRDALAPLGRRPGGGRGPGRVLHASLRALLAIVARAPYPDWAPRALAITGSGWPPCSPRSASGRRSPTSCSSTRPTSRSPTPTRTTSGSRRCSATRASTAVTWSWASAWCSCCSPCGGSPRGWGSAPWC